MFKHDLHGVHANGTESGYRHERTGRPSANGRMKTGILLVAVALIALGGFSWAAASSKPTTSPTAVIASDQVDDAPQAEADQTEEDTSHPSSATLSVPYVSQYPDLPTGCEITAATMLVNYRNDNVSDTDLATYLKQSNDFYYDDNMTTVPQGGSEGFTTTQILQDDTADGQATGTDGTGQSSSTDTTGSQSDGSRDSQANGSQADGSHNGQAEIPPDDLNYWHTHNFEDNPFAGMIGPDPDQVFVGDPTAIDGLYCNPQPAADAVNAYAAASGSTLKAKALSNCSTDQILHYVSIGDPVAVWVTLYMEECDNDLSWKTESGKMVHTSTFDHTMVITGYDVDADRIYVNDPIDSSSTEYSFAEFEASFNQRGRVALVVEQA